jgi:hypothetical protein
MRTSRIPLSRSSLDALRTSCQRWRNTYVRNLGEDKHMNMKAAIVAGGLAVSATGGLAQEVAVITPYLAQPGTQFYVEGFEARAAELGWTVNVIDTAGDVAAVISRIEDVVTQGVDAIVINVDPAQVGAGLQTAADAGSPSSVWMRARTPWWRRMSPRTATRWRPRRRSMSRTASAGRATWSCSSSIRSRPCRSGA